MKFEAKAVGRTNIPADNLIVLDHIQLRDADYSGRQLMKFTAIGSRIEQCHFNNARIEDASFGSGREMSEYVDCQFDGVHFSHGAGAARFVRCSFRDVQLHNWICNRVELIDCTFTGRLRKAIFSGTVPQQFRADVGRERNEFRGNDFSGMELIDVTFRAGVDLTQQKLPSGSQYIYLPDASEIVNGARSDAATWPESKDQKTAMGILNTLADEVKAGQKQLLLRPDDWFGLDSLHRNGVEKAFALLRGKLE